MKYKALLFSLFATANLFAQHPAIHFEIETDQPCQTMDYFGASDCWSMQFIGLWPQEKQNQVADWLFSTENHENGQPKGIGLSLWRFNVGAGSAEQGEASQIASPGCVPNVSFRQMVTIIGINNKGSATSCVWQKNEV